MKFDQLLSALQNWPTVLIFFILALGVFIKKRRKNSKNKSRDYLFGSAINLFISFSKRAIIKKLYNLSGLELKIEQYLEKSGKKSTYSLPSGNRLEQAIFLWPKAQYPYLYQKKSEIPKDILRPLYEDGKLIRGLDIVWLADRYITKNIVSSAAEIGFGASLLFGISFFILILLFFFSGEVVNTGYNGTISLDHWPGEQPESLPVLWRLDAWLSSFTQAAFTFSIQILCLVLSTVFVSLGTFPLVTLATLSRWHSIKSGPYRVTTKDAAVRWSYRAEYRNMVHSAYVQQIKLATTYLKNKPTFFIGNATGSLRMRGDLTAPTIHQAIKMDYDSLFQHLLVFGGTGEGKTTAILKPLARQILAIKTFGMFVCDAKGVLWRDIEIIAKQSGRESDVTVLGTGQGQFGVNIIANLTPTQITSSLRSVLKQISTSEGDSFWPDMAMNVLRHTLTIGDTYAKVLKNNHPISTKNPYNIWWAYQAILNESILNDALTEIKNHLTLLVQRSQEEGQNSKSFETLRVIYPEEVKSSFEYMERTWKDLAKDTKTGIISNITRLLDGFAGSPILRERFISGLEENTVKIEDALNGRIVLSSLSSIEDGLPARLVNILLKTSLYQAARMREIKFKSNPNENSPQDFPCAVMMDEAQEIVTSDPSSGLSDGSFWNVARSTGLAGIFATQTKEALIHALGEHAANNFMHQARSKVFLRSEDQQTLDYACWCAGQAERNRVFETGQFESLDTRLILEGFDPFSPVNEEEKIGSDMAVYFGKTSLQHLQKNRIYEVDDRFIPSSDIKTGINDSQVLQAKQAAHWRAEDLERSYLTNGNELHPLLNPTDIINMGRWHAFAHIQRAGVVRQDIIKIEHDFN